MEAHLRLPLVTLKLEGSTQKELFKNLAGAAEVFGESKCGICNSTNIRPVWRTVTKGKKSYDYPEYHCQEPNCRARLALGLNLEGGTMYPKRRLDEKTGRPLKSDEEGGSFKTNGWSKFKGNQDEDE